MVHKVQVMGDFIIFEVVILCEGYTFHKKSLGRGCVGLNQVRKNAASSLTFVPKCQLFQIQQFIYLFSTLEDVMSISFTDFLFQEHEYCQDKPTGLHKAIISGDTGTYNNI